jgi:D-alanyl-D-alanine carboxypeptidase/D-alanyl-D-alanine-endopeptidase (penicillin-binding protein 4)
VTASPRSPLVTALQIALLLSGWAVAVGLGLRLREKAAEQRPPVPLTEGKFDRLFREWSADPKLAAALIGFCLLDQDGRTVFASPLAMTALCPASSLKTVTTGAAFGLLGPEFRFETSLAGTAPINAEGLVAGDLVLIGGGDPTFSQADLFQLADDAVAGGLKKVAGRILVDVSIFPHDPTNEHWNWGDIGNAYGVGAFGLNLDHNRLEIRFAPGAAPGAPAKFLGGGPAPREIRWENQVTTGPADSGDEVVVYSEPYGRTITLRGRVPAGEGSFTVSGANPDPPALAAELLRARLESAGVTFANGPGASPDATRTILARHHSAPLPEIVDHLHKVSDNLEAQCLFLTIGQKQNTDPAVAIRAYWEKAGVEFVGLRLLDGSGLARASMIRPIDLARVNLAARRGPHGSRFFESLSAYANGNVRGKIGGMSGVKTQVGFIRTVQGRELTFALMGNGLPVDRGFWKRLEELLESVRTTEL